MSMSHKEALEAAVVAFEAWGGGSDGMDRAVRRYCKERWLVLVPKEATDEMVMTQGKSRPDLARTDAQRKLAEALNDIVRSTAVAVWSEMLAAAPDPFKDEAA